jgi:hypothetical protein
VRDFHDAVTGASMSIEDLQTVVTARARLHGLEPVMGVARLREQLAERDEIIVALQHVVRDLYHEVENLRAEAAFAASSYRRPKRASAAERPRPEAPAIERR